MANFQALILTKRLRAVVGTLPILSTDLLQDEAEWRRAYSILAFMVHAHVWCGDTPDDIVPPAISIPFLETCHHLELPAVATYAGLCLWNWRPLIRSAPVDSLENIFTLHTLTGSIDESWFFLVSIAIEARAGPIIPLMLDAMAAVRYNDQEAVTECLRAFAERLDELGSLLERMYENNDPHIFYHRIRPLLAGSKNMAEAGLPNGVLFDTGSSHDEYVQYAGGSNAQSSIIQFFDIVLGVEHRPTGNPPPGTPSVNFLHEMRRYMPGPHRRFLEHTERVANIRPFVVAHSKNVALRTAYDAALAMLRAFRDIHIQMVSRYIIVKSREAAGGKTTNVSPPRSVTKKINLATASSATGASLDENATSKSLRKLRGTGGTALIPFLKQARDETGEPAIDAWARRLLGNGPANVPRQLDPLTMGSGLATVTGARLAKMGEHASGEQEILGLAGVWTVDDSEGGICHW